MNLAEPSYIFSRHGNKPVDTGMSPYAKVYEDDKPFMGSTVSNRNRLKIPFSSGRLASLKTLPVESMKSRNEANNLNKISSLIDYR